MSGLYSIPISGLKEGRHYFEYNIDKAFFEQFEESGAMDGDLNAAVEADKRTSHISLTVRISGTIKIPCDRCLGIFEQPVDCTNRLLVKFGKVDDEDDPDMIVVPAGEHDLDLKQFFYEYMLLALPIRKIHPDDMDGNSTCDQEMIEKLKEHIVEDENSSDPRWEELRKLMNNN